MSHSWTRKEYEISRVVKYMEIDRDRVGHAKETIEVTVQVQYLCEKCGIRVTQPDPPPSCWPFVRPVQPDFCDNLVAQKVHDE